MTAGITLTTLHEGHGKYSPYTVFPNYAIMAWKWEFYLSFYLIIGAAVSEKVNNLSIASACQALVAVTLY